MFQFLTRPALAVCLLTLCQASALHAQRGASADPPGYLAAESLVRSHQWDQGLRALVPLNRKYPNNLKVLNLSGLAYTGKGDRVQADIYLRRAVKLAPSFVPALKNLGINEYYLHDFAAAQHHLELAATEAPGDGIICLYLGKAVYERQDYKRAAALLSGAGDFLSRDANAAAALAASYIQIGEKDRAFPLLDGLQPEELSPESQFDLGVSLAQAGLPGRAVPYLEAVQQNYPDSYQAGFNLTLSYTLAKSYPKAVAIANGLIAHGHETSELDNILAEAHEGNSETQQAVDALRRAIALEPANIDNYLDFAALCMNHREFDKGLTVIQVGLDAHPGSDRLVFVRGVLYAMQDKFDLAEKDFEEASTLAPQNNFGYVGLGVTYIETGNSGEAIQLLRRRLGDKPEDASLLYLLGEALIRSGAQFGSSEYAEAEAAFSKSVRLNPSLTLSHVSLGAIYLNENKPQDAVRELEQARLLDPNENSAYSHLAVAYRRLGQTDKAREMLASLKELLDQQREGSRKKANLPTQTARTTTPKTQP